MCSRLHALPNLCSGDSDDSGTAASVAELTKLESELAEFARFELEFALEFEFEFGESGSAESFALAELDDAESSQCCFSSTPTRA